jgi:hypothetical protein
MPIDPMEFGRVLERLDQQDEQIEEMRKDIRALLDMANQGKGALFVFMGIASVIGAIIGYVVSGRILK